MPEFINNYTAINKNIQEASLAFSEKTAELADIVYDLSKYYEGLGIMYNNMEIKNMYQIHKFMSDVMTCWGDTYTEQSILMRTQFSKFFTYHCHEAGPMRDLLKKRLNYKEDYARAEIRLNEKKERLFKSQDFEKWQLDSEGIAKLAQLKTNEEMAKKHMLSKETKAVEEKRNLLHYFSNQVKEQTTDIMDNNYTDLCVHLIDYACDQKKIYSKGIGNWNALFEHFNGLDLDIYDDEAEPKDAPAKNQSQDEKSESPKKTKELKIDPYIEEEKNDESYSEEGHPNQDHHDQSLEKSGELEGIDHPSLEKPDLKQPKPSKDIAAPKKEADDGKGVDIEDEYDMANPFDE